MQNFLQWRQPIEFLESPRFSVSGKVWQTFLSAQCAQTRMSAPPCRPPTSRRWGQTLSGGGPADLPLNFIHYRDKPGRIAIPTTLPLPHLSPSSFLVEQRR
jgi:hypothetical protein